MMKRFRWKRGVVPPLGIDPNKCYDGELAPGPAPRPKVFRLRGDDGKWFPFTVRVGTDVEPCDESKSG